MMGIFLSIFAKLEAYLAKMSFMKHNSRGHMSINLSTNNLVVCKKKTIRVQQSLLGRQESDISAVSLCEVKLVLDKAQKREAEIGGQCERSSHMLLFS